jgi:hypothetical protein
MLGRAVGVIMLGAVVGCASGEQARIAPPSVVTLKGGSGLSGTSFRVSVDLRDGSVSSEGASLLNTPQPQVVMLPGRELVGRELPRIRELAAHVWAAGAEIEVRVCPPIMDSATTLEIGGDHETRSYIQTGCLSSDAKQLIHAMECAGEPRLAGCAT